MSVAGILVGDPNNPTSYEQALATKIEAASSITGTVYRDRAVAPDVTGIDCAVGAGEVDVHTSWETTDLPFLTTYRWTPFDWGLATGTGASGVDFVTVVDDTHPLAAGKVAGTQTVLTSATDIFWISGTVANSANVANVGGSSTNWAIVGWDTDVTVNRRVFLGFFRPVHEGLQTANADDFLHAAMDWLLELSTGLAVPANFTFAKVADLRQIDAAADPVTDANSYELEWQEWDGSQFQPKGVETNATPSFTVDDTDGVNWGTLYRGRMRAMP